MERFIGFAKLWMVGAALLAATAVADPPPDHTTNRNGRLHAENNDLPYSSHCTDCHAPNLLGGLGPSCRQCHGMLWSPTDIANLAPPLDHTELKGGFALHKLGFGFPYAAECTLCHGANLNDGFAPSCFSCHDRIWGGEGPPADHTELFGGFAEHKPGYEDPFAGGCTQCHGPNLDDGFAPSCFSCHGAIWAGGGPPTDHTELRGGFAEHKPGLGAPFDNGCTQCHGPNLDDGFAPSCYSCHSRIWAGEGPPDDHTDLRGGFAEHKPGLQAPFANNCTQCHGPNLDDGFAPSCFTCHGEVWGQGNLPPVVDAGGPYAGTPGQPVGFDASGTVDPESDPLTFEWDFGDGSDPTSPSADPTAAHTYSQAGAYTARVTVSDGVNDSVSAEVAVNISDTPPPAGSESWSVTTTASPPETFTITFEHHATVFLALKDDGAGPPTLAMGVEFGNVIFWMDLWMELSGNIFWGTGNSYFGNVDRVNGTMSGVVFDDQGGVFTFSGTALD